MGDPATSPLLLAFSYVFRTRIDLALSLTPFFGAPILDPTDFPAPAEGAFGDVVDGDGEGHGGPEGGVRHRGHEGGQTCRPARIEFSATEKHIIKKLRGSDSASRLFVQLGCPCSDPRLKVEALVG